MSKRKRKKRRGNYAAKVAVQGSDSYGTWRDGKRLSPERIAGRTLY